MKKQPLRHIAVTVVEPRAGSFRWKLLEEDDDGQWAALQQGDVAFDTYAQAMAAGLLALQGRVDDLARGPRAQAPAAPGEAARASRHKPAPVDADGPPAGHRLFGFGPLR